MDYNLMKGVAERIESIDLQKAEDKELKVLLSLAELEESDYPDRDSTISALKKFVETSAKAQKRIIRKKGDKKADYFGTDYFGTVRVRRSKQASQGKKLPLLENFLHIFF